MTDEENLNAAKLAMLGPKVWVVTIRGHGDLWTYVYATRELAEQECWDCITGFWETMRLTDPIPTDLFDAMDALRDHGGAYETFEIEACEIRLKI